MTEMPLPDPKRGVFETMLVVDGHPIELGAHLERMDASLGALFGSNTPSSAGELVQERARGIGLGRLRLTVVPSVDGGLGAEVATAEVEPEMVFPSAKRSVTLYCHLVEGGLGAHKWADRRLLEAAEGDAPAGSVPLLLDVGGVALEASRANLFAVLAGAIITPPTDGRILPGIARLRAIEAAKEDGIAVREEEMALDRLTQADEVFLTGSVRGVEPVSSIDGIETILGGKVSAQIAARLKRRWMSASGP